MKAEWKVLHDDSRGVGGDSGVHSVEVRHSAAAMLPYCHADTPGLSLVVMSAKGKGNVLAASRLADPGKPEGRGPGQQSGADPSSGLLLRIREGIRHLARAWGKAGDRLHLVAHTLWPVTLSSGRLLA